MFHLRAGQQPGGQPQVRSPGKASWCTLPHFGMRQAKRTASLHERLWRVPLQLLPARPLPIQLLFSSHAGKKKGGSHARKK